MNYLPLFGRGWRFSAFFASTIPIASGGDDAPDQGAAAAMTAGISARSAMDNALFAVNYSTVIGGLGLAGITRGSTLQAEGTVLRLTRARGPSSQGRTLKAGGPAPGPPGRATKGLPKRAPSAAVS